MTSAPHVTLPAPEHPAEGLSGYVFPMQDRGAPFGLIVFSVDPGACTEAHSHAIREYWLVTVGKGRVVYDGESYSVSEGDMLYFEPHKSHQVVNDSDSLLRIVSIDWHGQDGSAS